MNSDRLVAMANDIAAFFAGESDRETAVAGIASHIVRFWERRMRSQIVSYYLSGGGGLSPLAMAAVARLAEEQVPSPR
jgi:formate dehydrogenase subunit delta